MKYVEVPWLWWPLGNCPACPFLNPALTEGYPILGPMPPLVSFMISMLPLLLVLPILKLWTAFEIAFTSSYLEFCKFRTEYFWILDFSKIEEIRAYEGYENSLKVRKQYNIYNLWGDLNLAYESIHFTFLESKRKGLRSKRLISGISTLPIRSTLLYLNVVCLLNASNISLASLIPCHIQYIDENTMERQYWLDSYSRVICYSTFAHKWYNLGTFIWVNVDIKMIFWSLDI